MTRGPGRSKGFHGARHGMHVHARPPKLLWPAQILVCQPNDDLLPVGSSMAFAAPQRW